jgi:hypothetical protein
MRGQREPAAPPTARPPTGRERLWRCAAASARGSSHEKTGLPCQDAHRVERLGADLLVAAVADGAGSAAHAEVGAATAVAAALDSIRGRLESFASCADDEVFKAALLESIGDARSAVEREAEERAQAAREFASTLILVVATPDFVAAAQVGDGGVVLRDACGGLVALTSPEFGEYVNEVCFLTSPGAERNTQARVWRGRVGQLAMFSDGLELLCLRMPEGEPHGPFFEPVFDFVKGAADEERAGEELNTFLLSPRVRAQTDDDTTLILASLSAHPCEFDSNPAAG